MIASRVVSEEELQTALRELGFKLTEESTNTGVFWRHCDSGKHVLVPNSVQGFYPNWLLEDITEQIGLIQIRWINN